MSVPLVGSLMFGNHLRACGLLERLSQTEQKELASLVTSLLGLTIGSTMIADNFLRWDTLLIMALGLFAFIFDTAGGVLFAKFLNLFRKEKINPRSRACISAVPIARSSSRRWPPRNDPTTFVSCRRSAPTFPPIGQSTLLRADHAGHLKIVRYEGMKKFSRCQYETARSRGRGSALHVPGAGAGLGMIKLLKKYRSLTVGSGRRGACAYPPFAFLSYRAKNAHLAGRLTAFRRLCYHHVRTAL
jgi:hypothetical protein